MLPQRRRFTLIELLVVVVIMTVLVSLLLPALGQARAHAKSIACVGNLKQLGQGLHLYANDYDDTLMVSYYPDYHGQIYTWGMVLGDYLSMSQDVPAKLGIFRCPENQVQEFRCKEWGYGERYLSYGANAEATAAAAWDHHYLGSRLSAQLYPDQLMALLECTYFRVFSTWSDAGLMTNTRWAHHPATSLLWADGHANTYVRVTLPNHAPHFWFVDK